MLALRKNWMSKLSSYEPKRRRSNHSDTSNMDNDYETEQSWLTKAEKRVVGSLSGKKIANLLADDAQRDLLAHLRESIITHTGKKDTADNLIRATLKLSMKVALLEREGNLPTRSLEAIDDFRLKFHSALQTAITFYEVDFLFNRDSLKDMLDECRCITHRIIDGSLSAKSHESVNQIFSYLTTTDYIDKLFDKTSPLYPSTKQLIPHLKDMMRRRMM